MRANSGPLIQKGNLSEHPHFSDAEPVRYVTDGHDQIGLVYPAGKAFEALLTSGRRLGLYRTARLASSAISEANREECSR